MAAMLWRPRLFAALGAGFKDDTTLREGVHLRWTLDPRLGLPHTPDQAGFEIAFLRTKERSLTRVDLFQTTQPYPVHSSQGGLGAGPSAIRRDGASLSFTRPLKAGDWLPLWLYLHRRAALWGTPQGLLGKGLPLLSYLDKVMAALAPQGPGTSVEEEDVVAVDLRFHEPLGGTGPDVPGGVIVEPFPGGTILAPRTLDLAGRLGGILDARLPRLAARRGGILEALAATVYADIRGYDHCDRLVASDWVGRRGLLGGGRPPDQDRWKLVAQLRAPGIRRVEVVPRQGRPALQENEIRWIFCDEFAAKPGLWATIGTEVLETDPGRYTGDWLRDEIHAPFQAGAAPLDWAEMATRLRARFLGAAEIQTLLAASDSFETATVAAEITDTEAPTGTGDDSVALPLLAALNAAATDPVVARLLGLYGYTPPNPDIVGCDWRVLARPPFAEPKNLETLDARLRDVADPGGPFFLASDALTGLQLAGLVLNAEETKKPPPPKPLPTLEPELHLVPDRVAGARHLVRAQIGAAPDEVETDPTRVNASYEVVRELTGELPANVVGDSDRGPLDDIGILPDVLVPAFDRETCRSTGKLCDVFSRDALSDRELAYLVRGFDIFGRPSDPGATPSVALPAACLPPPPPRRSVGLRERGRRAFADDSRFRGRDCRRAGAGGLAGA